MDIPKHFKYIKIDDYIIMPNHIHVIMVIEKEFINKKQIANVGAGLDQPENKEKILDIPQIIGLYKSGVSRKCNMYNGSIWQRNYYEHIIRNEKEYYEIKQYIRYNPVNWYHDKYFN